MIGNFVDTIDEVIRCEIRERLKGIEDRNKVRILFAIESGSRAWGFPSPNSDYDVRFVYCHPVDWYLSIEPGRDVIELPIEGDWDINGWDLKKALRLLIKPNPVLLEWLSSPIRYVWQDDACQQLIHLSRKSTHGHACLHHYLSLGSRQWKTYVQDRDQVDLKKYFYAVRPAMAIRWVRRNPAEVPPMSFPDLKRGIGLSVEVSKELDKLLELKSRSKELGKAGRIEALDRFITCEFEWALQAVKQQPMPAANLTIDANALFRDIVHG